MPTPARAARDRSAHPTRRRPALAALLALALLVPERASADVSLGAWTTHSPDDLTLAKVPGLQTLSGNDVTVTVALPFAVTIEGVAYTSVAISTNGWLEFGGNTAVDSSPTNACLPTATHTNPLLAAYWDDLDTFGTNVRFGTVGTSPNRTFLVDYQADVDPSVDHGGDDDLSFQVQIHEGSSVMSVRYRDDGVLANGQTATIGFQGAGGASATAEPITCNGKVLDDNRQTDGFSIDAAKAGHVSLFAMLAHSPDDITGFTSLSGNDNVATATLPFSVAIEGTTYGTVAISTNGWLEFGGNTAGGSDPNNTALPTASHTNPFLAPYWDDIQTHGTAIRYGTVGTAPNRTFVVDFEGDVVALGGSDNLHYQVQVHEGSNLITVKYRDAIDNQANGQTATIGFQGAGGASAAAYPLTFNGKILDDNTPNAQGWSVHRNSGGQTVVHATTEYSPDDIGGFTSFSGDDVVTTVGLPFGVVIDGTSWASVAISTNGWLELGGNTSGGADPANTALPTASHQNPFVAAFWDDLQTEGNNVRYGVVGSAPDRTFVVDWEAYITPSPDSGADGIQFQAQIHETSNVITVQYRTAQREADGQTATIGFQGAGGAAARAYPLSFNGKILDDNDPSAGWSVSPLPVCGNGALEPAGGEQCDLGAANGGATSCCTSTCTFRAGGSVCRVGGGAPCDLDETCTGTGSACPPDDAPTKAGIVTCRVGSGDACDPDELCNGVPGVACPADAFAANTTVCRTGSGDVCDPAETCPGVPGQPCPPNVVNGGATVCRVGSGDACDASEHCSGVPGATCPPDDAPLKAGTVCRGGSGDVCDQNETCTGVPGATCPPDDAPAKLGYVCRPSSAAGAFCDEPEACTGVPGSTCPPDDAPQKINVVCRHGSGDLCDPDERCTGVPGQGCPPDVVANPTVVCRAGSGDVCDPAEHCTAIPGAPCPADVVAPAGTECRASTGTCDVAEHCGGAAGQACPADAFAPANAPCDRDADACTRDACDGGGACTYRGPLDCDDGNACTQDACDPQTGCTISGTPSTTCLPAGRAKLQVKDAANDAGDRLKLDWRGGPLLLADLGDPRQATRYELCVYDDAGVRMALGVLPGTGWKAIGPPLAPVGYKYKDKGGVYAGVKAMTLKGSSLPRASLKLSAGGTDLPDGALPLQPHVTAQLHAGDGACWEASFGPAETLRSDAATFVGRAIAP